MSKDKIYSPVPTSMTMKDEDENLEVRIVKPVDSRDSKQPR